MGINPKVLVADNRYMDDNVIKYAYDNNIRLIIPDRNESSKNKSKNREKPYHKVNFMYDWKTDSFICPMGEHLHYKNDRKLNGEWMRVYSTNKCKTCPVKKQCTKSREREIIMPQSLCVGRGCGNKLQPSGFRLNLFSYLQAGCLRSTRGGICLRE